MPFRQALLLILAGAGPAAAHDLWLVPAESYTVGKPALVRAGVGMDFPTSVHVHDTERYPRRVLVKPDGTAGELKPAGKDGMFGLLRFEPTQPGVYAVAVETKPRVIELSAEKFNAYLVTDGLAHIFHLRAQEKMLDKPARERYRKSPKALIRVGVGGGGDPTRPIGLPLEIVPRGDPFALKIGQTLRVRVLLHNQPLAAATLGWQHPGDGDSPRGTARTDARGEALIPIGQTGLMTIRLTHMTRPRAADYEWESYWTSLTFRIPD